MGRPVFSDGFLPEYVSNDTLHPDMIPSRDAPWHEIVHFSLTFSGYQKAGSFNRCTEVSCSNRCTTLSEMRAFLYSEQLRWRRAGSSPDKPAMAGIYDLLDRMREKVRSGQRE